MENCVPMSPAVVVVGGKVFLFYSAVDSRISQVGCARLAGEPLHVEDQAYLVLARQFGTHPSVTCALKWGPHMYAYIQGEQEMWRAICGYGRRHDACAAAKRCAGHPSGSAQLGSLRSS